MTKHWIWTDFRVPMRLDCEVCGAEDSCYYWITTAETLHKYVCRACKVSILYSTHMLNDRHLNGTFSNRPRQPMCLQDRAD